MLVIVKNMTKVAIVTGAGSGIGRAVSLRLAESGFSLVLAGRRQHELERVAGSIRQSSGADSLAVPTDVTNPEQVDKLFESATRHFRRIDVLFNNAGVSAPSVPLDQLSLNDWNHVIAVNLTGAFLCAQAAFRYMKDQHPAGGRIINNGSISALTPRPDSAPYTATKHAITGLTKSLALDGRRFNIACGQIDIGNAETEMTGRIATGVPQADGRLAPEPVMAAAHVADAVLYMAGLPLDANVLFMTIMATAMPFVGRG